MFLYETYHNPFLGFEGAAVVFSSALRFVPDGPGTLAAAVSLLSPSDELDLGEELPVEEEVTVEVVAAGFLDAPKTASMASWTRSVTCSLSLLYLGS